MINRRTLLQGILSLPFGLKPVVKIIGYEWIPLKQKVYYINKMCHTSPFISKSPTFREGLYNCHIQKINVSKDLGRTEIMELGRRGPYTRFVQFPVKV